MAELKDIVAYLLQQFPVKHDLSKTRVTKMVYLADWHQAINYDKQVSNISWYFDNYGPYVTDVQKVVSENKEIFVEEATVNPYGQLKKLFQINNKEFVCNLKQEEKDSLDHVINNTKMLNWSAFIKLVYSTYPIVSSQRYSQLDLLQKAKEYKQII